jgi:hypothetical protein
MAFPSLKQFWDLARKAEDLFKLQEKIEKLLSGHDERLRALEDRLIRLEAEQDQVISDAKTAATAAAMTISTKALENTVTRLTRVEMGVERIEQGRLPPPAH